MKILTELPPGDWSIIVWDDCVIAACPEHQSRIVDLQTGRVTIIAPIHRPTIIRDYSE